MTEKRRFLRFETALNAFFEVVSEKFKAATKVKNISKEGALIVVGKPLQEGDEIRLSMDVPGDNVPIFAAAKVAWQRDARKNNAAFETGVKFTHINNLDKGRLLEYIYAQWLHILDTKE